MKNLTIIIIIVISITELCFAQIEINLYTGVNTPIGKNSFSNYFFNYYYPGLNLGSSINYPLNKKFFVSPFFEFSNYIFKPYNSGGPGIPEVKFVSASGSASQFYKIGFNFRFVPSTEPLPQGYFFTGFCWNIESTGKINKRFYDMNNGYFVTSEKFNGKNYLSQIFGIGIRLAEFGLFQLMIEGIFYTNYSDRNLTSANIGIYF